MPSSSLSRWVDRTLSRTQAMDHPQGLDGVYEGDNPIVDIVALHGLNGHREKTWTAENGVHWLRDLLPKDLPQARILCYGYDANTHSTRRVSWNNIYDHATNLVSDLYRKRKITNSINRPIIFIAHSLGGIVLKSALIHSNGAQTGALPEHRSIKLSTYGILFMGTPHQGGNGVQLGRVLANVASLFVAANNRLLKQLEHDSESLQQQLVQFNQISNDFVIKFVYEEYKTPTILGHSIMVVPKASAVVPGQANAEAIVIHSNHTSMVRYLSSQDDGYKAVSEHLKIMVTDAPAVVQLPCQAETRVHDASGNTSCFTLPLSLSGLPERSHFVAREEELARMYQALGNKPGRRTVVVHGLGGMGKTQLAIAYMRQHRNLYTASIWLNARDQTSLHQGFRNVAVRILQEYPDLGYMANAASDKNGNASLAVKRWLNESKNDRWLLIYDNYDHPVMEGVTDDVPLGEVGGSSRPNETDQAAPEGYDIRQFLPDTDHGAIIVTTRSSAGTVFAFWRQPQTAKEFKTMLPP
ncbi:Protein SERAC1 like protein [Verticillium longisporum]|uniref:Protein SERAC1 like protein n=1 Tax=Verticillium longisporum TaxID=100787 RepID=A0A8I2ZBV3_VERLO|nr:Protein SERAC1 like protein [Verticillium longisporum]